MGNQHPSQPRPQTVVNVERYKIRFGPWSDIKDSGRVPAIKDEAWDHLVRKSLEKQGATPQEEPEAGEILQGEPGAGAILQKYVDAIKDVVQEIPENMPRHYYHMTLIKDGSFFLQLALLVLGCYEELGYNPDHMIFGLNNMKRGSNDWIEEMLAVNNQIPLVFLQIFMAQKFFKDIVLKKRKWTPNPSSLVQKVFYALLILPVLKGVPNQGLPWIWLAGRRSNVVGLERANLLDGLRILLTGHLSDDYEDDDLEANEDGYNNASTNVTASIDLSATNLKRSGIYIKKVESGGIRNIEFHDYWCRANVDLPTFPVDDDTEIILQNLILHEKNRFRRHQQREVSSYIKFMNGIVRTKKDAKLLADSKIILGNPEYVEKLPGILKRLVASASSSDDHIVLTPQLQAVIRRIRDHSPIWTRFKQAIGVVVFLTVLLTLFQAVLALLQYIHPLH